MLIGLETQKGSSSSKSVFPVLRKLCSLQFILHLIIFAVNASVNAADTEVKIQIGFLPGFSNHPATNPDSQFKSRTPPSLLKFIGHEGKYVPGCKVSHPHAGALFGCPSGEANIGGLTHSC